MRAGFAEIEITPPVGTRKIGCLKEIVSDRVLDPLYARAAAFDDGAARIGFLQLDTLSVRWTQVDDIRRRVAEAHGFPGANLMVAATHNHAGPAVATVGESRRDETYVETLTEKCVHVLGQAIVRLGEAELGFGHVFEFGVGFNRRIVMRDGTVRTQQRFENPDALYVEGPIDPEVAVLAARGKGGELLGALVNFACHPTHFCGTTELSAGYPSVLAAEMKARGCPVTLFLNGASGNIITVDYTTGMSLSKEEAGRALAADAWRAIEGMTFSADWPLSAASETVRLPYRAPTQEQLSGTARGAQRFVDPAIYERGMPALVKRIRERGDQPAEVQALRLGELAFVGVPAEYFVEHGLRIKTETCPARRGFPAREERPSAKGRVSTKEEAEGSPGLAWRHSLVVGHANGMVGYVPTRRAFERGGYETTFAGSSRMAPEAGDMLAEAAIRLIRGLPR